MTAPPAASGSASTTRGVQILEAARIVFARFGFRKASMDDVAREAGISRQCVYWYFETKEALFREMVVYILNNSFLEIEGLRSDRSLGIHGKLILIFENLMGKQTSHPVSGRLEMVGAFCSLFEKKTRAEYIARLDLLVGGMIREAVAGKSIRLGHATPEETAETLREVSEGIASRCEDAEDFKTRMGRALRVILPPVGN